MSVELPEPVHARGVSTDLKLLLLFRILRSLSAGMIALSFPYLILRTLHLSALTLGALFTAGSIASALLGFVAGFLADIWGRKQTLLAVGVLLPFSSALLYRSSAPLMLFVAAACGGISATGSLAGGGVGGAVQPILTAALAGLTGPQTRTRYFSIFTFASGVSAAAGMLCAKAFAGRQIFLAATIVAAVGVVLLLPIRLKDVAGSVRHLPSVAVIGQFTLTGAFNGFAQGLIMPFLIPFFILVYHMPRSRMSIYGFVAGALGAAALLLAPRLERGWGFVKSVAITRGLGAALLVLLPVIGVLPIALAIYAVTPALRVAAMPVQQATLTEMVSDAEVGRALGINQVARLVASSGGITLSGCLLHTGHMALPFYLYGGLMAINIVLYFRFFDGR